MLWDAVDNSHAGGKVENADHREYGKAEITIKNNSKLFGGNSGKASRMDEPWRPCNRAPEGFEVMLRVPLVQWLQLHVKKRNIYLVQFHPEVRHSIHGTEIFRKFIFNVCRAKADWSMKNFIEDAGAKHSSRSRK